MKGWEQSKKKRHKGVFSHMIKKILIGKVVCLCLSLAFFNVYAKW
ncbi:hypothetical protein NU09_1638 [Flavobacterium beibuense]|uniref:Uncharacterized protein n=1 Tax=Flavobacterium beibuense TaxID=657326 RepID=A0A444WBU9_9FLAO|nr:hypothetical protein NU09_1638 [Flavobacterium beibuense]